MSEFITLTDYVDNHKPCIARVSEIIAVDQETIGTVDYIKIKTFVRMKQDVQVCVKETPEEVLRLINENQ